jgi:hypothetical protein
LPLENDRIIHCKSHLKIEEEWKVSGSMSSKIHGAMESPILVLIKKGIFTVASYKKPFLFL